MPKINCTMNNHLVVKVGDAYHCITCLENEIIRLRSYVEKGCDLLIGLNKYPVVHEFRKRAYRAIS